MTDFGTRLRGLRIGHNMTQDEAAAAINVSKQAISKWENDRGLPDVSSLGALAELYGTTVDYLLTGEEKVKVKKEIVEKEKIVEVEKPLTKEMLKALQERNFVAFRLSYGCIIMGSIALIAALATFVLYIIPKTSSYVMLILSIVWLVVGIGLVCWGCHNLGKYKAVKKEVEEKTGMKIGAYYFKKDKNVKNKN